MTCPVCESVAEGEDLVRVIAPAVTGVQLTCSEACHERLVEAFETPFGKDKRVTRMSTGETFRVPGRQIIEGASGGRTWTNFHVGTISWRGHKPRQTAAARPAEAPRGPQVAQTLPEEFLEALLSRPMGARA